MLPISVAFLVGGKAGSIIGIKEFQILPAIGWAAIIGIIDYNFSIMKKLGALGWVGRIVLIMTSAVITATIGDHIVFADTIKEEREKIAGESPEIAQKTTTWNNAIQAVKKSQASVDKLNVEFTKETSGDGSVQGRGYGPAAKAIERKIENENANLIYLRKQSDLAKTELDEVKGKREKSHNIIEEIQLLYSLIFKSFASASIFILLSLMVICIETLPLLLKSGETYDQVNSSNKIERDKYESTILRNNRI